MRSSNLQRNIKPKTSFRNMMHSGPIFWLSIIILFFLARGAIITVVKERETARLADESKKKMLDLENRGNDLTQRIEYLKTPDGEEAELRALYNAARPDESVVLIVDSKSKIATTTERVSLWQKIKNIFSN